MKRAVLSARTARRAFPAAWICGLLLAACAPPPPPTPPPPPRPKTLVVLMPDEDGNVGAVSVSNDGGVQTIDQAFAAVTTTAMSAAPASAVALGRAPVDAAYAALLRAQPLKPKSFTLHFLLDSTTLTAESKALVPEVIAAVRDRKPTVVTVYGHSDASGTDKRNLKLSADRANAVADFLRKSDASLDRIQVQYFGAKAPAVPTEPHAVEPRNRRAEVVVL